MEYVIVTPALASFSFIGLRYLKNSLIASTIVVVITSVFLCTTSGLVGAKLHGKYEIGRNGEGKYPWRPLSTVKAIIEREIPKGYYYNALTTEDYLTFLILDAGLMASKIDVAEDPNSYTSPKIEYDIILLPNEHFAYFHNSTLQKYRQFEAGDNQTLLIRKGL
jgi:hypothetical protein